MDTVEYCNSLDNLINEEEGLSKLRMAVIGAGYLGSIHAQLALSHSDVELVAVVDPDASARKRVADWGIRTVDHTDELVGQIDAAIVACPTREHFQVARRLLTDDVHLFVEKPFTTTVQEADELIQLAEQRHLVVQVGHVERFNPALKAAAPYLTDITYVEAVRTSGYACRSTDIGVVLDLMIHDLDIVMHLVDRPLQELHATGTVVVGPHEDTAEARLVFSDGVVATLKASRVSRENCRSMRVVTRTGVVELDFAARRCWWQTPCNERLATFHPERLTAEERESVRRRFFEEYLPRVELPVTESNALYEEQREFIDSVLTGRSPAVSAIAARDVLAVAESIRNQIARFTQQMRLRALPVIPRAAEQHWIVRRRAG